MECSKDGRTEYKRQTREYRVSTAQNERWIMNLLKLCYVELKNTERLLCVRVDIVEGDVRIA